MRSRAMLSAVAAALAVGGLVVAAAGVGGRAADRAPRARPLVGELVNDHLRVLAAARPAELESGDPREATAWLASRVGFAPVVSAPPRDVQLRGAALGYVFDRQAALLLYRLRLHQLTLLAFRAEGFDWPGDDGASASRPPLTRVAERGFHAVLWRGGGIGYALVSDSNPAELVTVAAGLAAAAESGGAR